MKPSTNRVYKLPVPPKPVPYSPDAPKEGAVLTREEVEAEIAKAVASERAQLYSPEVAALRAKEEEERKSNTWKFLDGFEPPKEKPSLYSQGYKGKGRRLVQGSLHVGGHHTSSADVCGLAADGHHCLGTRWHPLWRRSRIHLVPCSRAAGQAVKLRGRSWRFPSWLRLQAPTASVAGGKFLRLRIQSCDFLFLRQQHLEL